MTIDLTSEMFKLAGLSVENHAEFIIETSRNLLVGLRERQRDIKADSIKMSESRNEHLKELKASLLKIVGEIDLTLEASLPAGTRRRLQAESIRLRMQHRARQIRS
jgi:hypothetical protein